MLHRLHPGTKVAWLIWATVAVFLFDSPVLPLAVAACALMLLWFCGHPPWRVTGLRLWLPLGLAIFVTQIIVERGGSALIGSITSDGLTAGCRSVGRLLAVVLTSTLFVTTTEPVMLAQGLVNCGLPYRWGFALVTALRLAPAFKIEAHHVYQAQLVRGVAYDAVGPRRWWLLLHHLCLPLLVSALRTAHALALSMEGRAFGLHPSRTTIRRVSWELRDAIALACLLLSMFVAWWC
jgi:energy-coupling factor transport system permease protein